MRRWSIVIAAGVIATVALGWLWSRHRMDGGQPLAKTTIQHPTFTGGAILRDTPETKQALEVVRARAKASYGYDVWRETACHGVSLFYLPDAKDENVAWYWFDLQSKQLEQTTLGEVVQALAPHLEAFELFTPNYMIGQLDTPEGRPLYSIGRLESGGIVQIGFSSDRCSAVPDIAQVMTWDGPLPIGIDLPAAIKQIQQQERNEASNSQL